MMKIASISLPNAGSIDKVERGELNIPKGQKCPRLRLKVVVPINNTSGGAVTLTDAQKQAVLQHLDLSVSWGKSGRMKPYAVVRADKVQRIARSLAGTEIEGYTDTSTGLQRSLPNSATTNVTFYLLVVLGQFWKLKDPNVLAFGRSQLASLELEVRRAQTAPTILANVIVSGTISADISPDLVPAKGDPVSPGVWYEESDSANKTAALSEGMCLQLEERTAAHASSTLTNVTVKFDDLVVHDQASPAEIITETNDVPTLPAEASVTDRVTLLMTHNRLAMELGDMPSGRPQVTQNVKDLATILLAQLYIPVLDRSALLDFAEYVSEELRPKKLKLASRNVIDRLGVPVHAAFAAPSVLLDEDDAEWEEAPGYVIASGKAPSLEIPTSQLDAIKARFARLKVNEPNAAQRLARELTAGVPGAVQSTRGFRRGDATVLEQITRAIGG